MGEGGGGGRGLHHHPCHVRCYISPISVISIGADNLRYMHMCKLTAACKAEHSELLFVDFRLSASILPSISVYPMHAIKKIAIHRISIKYRDISHIAAALVIETYESRFH